jgi:hypothetical protein
VCSRRVTGRVLQEGDPSCALNLISTFLLLYEIFNLNVMHLFLKFNFMLLEKVPSTLPPVSFSI